MRCGRGEKKILSAPPCTPPSPRKLYWTDGDNISMANMDGSNRTLLFSDQKGPVGMSWPCLPRSLS